MKIEMTPIGVFHTKEENIPRHWRISEVKGEIEIDAKFEPGLKDIKAGQKIAVLFYFHKSEPFDTRHLIQHPKHKKNPMGVFSICSPYRPNPIGLSVLSVLKVEKNIITVNHADMFDGTPILDIKPDMTDMTGKPE